MQPEAVAAAVEPQAPLANGGGASTKRLTASTFKTAGVDTSFSWNSTTPVKDRPILFYYFDSSVTKGRNFDESKTFEVKVFPNRTVTKLAEKFICEKICFKNELGKRYKGRDMLEAFKASLKKIPLKKRKAGVVFLSPEGKVLHKVKLARSAGKFAKAMKFALKQNDKLLAKKKKAEKKSGPVATAKVAAKK